MPCDDVDDILVALNAAADEHEAGSHDDRTIVLQRLWPDDQIADAELVFEGDEDDALGAAGALAHEHDAGH